MDNETNIDTKKSIKAISPIVNFLKEYWWLNLIIGAIGIYAFFFGSWGDYKIKASFKNSILHEVQIARNTLDYTLAQRNINVRNRPTFSLELSSIVPETFADKPQLKNELIDLYRALSSAQKGAEELMSLLASNNSDPNTIQNRENDIKRAIDFADIVGPKVAEFIGSTWQKPPSDLTPQQKVEFYEDNCSLIYSVASDAEVDFRWQIK